MKKFRIMKVRRTGKVPEVQERFKALSAIAPGTLEYREAYFEYITAVEKELEKSRFMHGPPGSAQIGAMIRKIKAGNATASEIEEFRRLAVEVLRHPRCGPAFEMHIESALSLVERS